MKLLHIAASILSSCIMLGSLASTSYAQNLTNEELAYTWAPIHIQDVNKRHAEGRADYITAIDYDGDWNTTNNWDNLHNFPLNAVAYYAVTESDTHWFIYYMFYHPRDWVVSSWRDSTHENDAEGTLIIVKKTDGAYGRFEGMITEAHGHLLSFPSAPCDLQGCRTSLHTDPWNMSDRPRPCTYQEHSGHGMRACFSDETLNRKDDSIVYIPSWGIADTPPFRIDDGRTIPIRYALVNLDWLWNNRNDPSIFTESGTFQGDCSGMDSFSRRRCRSNGANPPWQWGNTFAFDPAQHLRSDRYFSQTGEWFSSNYWQMAFP